MGDLTRFDEEEIGQIVEVPAYRYGCSTFLDTARPISLRFRSLQVNDRRDELDACALSLVV